jgi:hypothetical protein
MPSRIAYELGAEQYAALLTDNQQRLVRRRWSWPRRVAYQATLILVSAVVVLLVGEVWLGSREGRWLALALVGGIVLLGIQQAMFQKDLLRRIAEGSCLVRRPPCEYPSPSG